MDVPVTIRLPELDAKLDFHPGVEPITVQLRDASGELVAEANASSGQWIVLSGLDAGEYASW